MFSDRIFKITFLISLIVHGVILYRNPSLAIFSINKKEKELEVSYFKDTQKPEETQEIIASKREPPLKILSRIKVDKKIPPPFIDREGIFKKDRDIALHKPAFTKPVFTRPDVIAIRKKIALPPIDIDKINNPSYINYYQTVREKIKRSAYQNYTRTDVGEVFLSFIISNNGNLEEVHLNEEKSISNSYLKDIALRSIKDSGPFPKFPQELDYSRLSFNVVISFQIE